MRFVDQQTFKELNIIRNQYSSINLIDKIDETVTSEGKQNLINHLRFPFLSIQEIESFQKMICCIRDNLESWIPFQDILQSDEYKKIEMLKERRLVHTKPLLPFEYSYFSPQKINPNYLLLIKVKKVCDRILEECHSAPVILTDLQKLLLEFNDVFRRKKAIKYANWYCLSHKYKEYSRIFEILYRLDAYISIAKAHNKLDLSYPTWITEADETWGFHNLRNLLIENVVPNDFILQKDTKVVFLTGPNMAGKSSLMISFGQAIYMARCGLGVPADKALIPWSDNLFTAFESSTSIEAGLSYFASEVKRSVKGVESTREGKASILLIDELFKGTNILDSQDCLDYFIEQLQGNDSICMVATHLIDYVESNQNSPSVEHFYFAGDICGEDFQFDYILKKGISKQRLGLNILKKNLSEAFH